MARAKQTEGTTEEKKAPTTGQSGPEISLKLDELNTKERRLLTRFAAEGKRETRTIKELADECWKKNVGNERANSWVRNSLRRLIRARLLEKVEEGTYRLSVKGREKLRELARSTIAPPAAAEVSVDSASAAA